ncbi:MAG: tetratricopeptide repeat protein [Acidobacteria bacterium]|nr:tetratricopeptide repeat protein [Acidobacteriota bacterium]
MSRSLLTFVLLGAAAAAGTAQQDAERLYNRTDYQGALHLLVPQPNKDARTWTLVGKSYFGVGEYKKATEAFEQAVALDPRNADAVHWLGKCWGRRAEIASVFTAPGYASKARQYFEKAVLLDMSNREAIGDLFDYYMEAPGFLGGGLNRAEALADRIATLDEAEGDYLRAQVADHRKEFDKAEQYLRRALELAPRQVGRTIELAKYLSKLGRVQESEATFAQAEKITPNNPRILYERAQTYIRDKRNLAQARELLKQYLASPVTANDPPKSKAEELLRKAGA